MMLGCHETRAELGLGAGQRGFAGGVFDEVASLPSLTMTNIADSHFRLWFFIFLTSFPVFPGGLLGSAN